MHLQQPVKLREESALLKMKQIKSPVNQVTTTKTHNQTKTKPNPAQITVTAQRDHLQTSTSLQILPENNTQLFSTWLFSAAICLWLLQTRINLWPSKPLQVEEF